MADAAREALGTSRTSSRASRRRASETRKAVADAPPGHLRELFEDDRAVHLRRAPDAIGERDRHLDDALAGLGDSIGHLHLEEVTAGVGRLVLDLLQRRRAPGAVPGGE